MKKTVLIATLMATVMSSGTRQADAASCTFSVPDKNASGDNHYYALWHCRQDIIDFFWYKYDFDKPYWEKGWGYYDPCNSDLPLAREFSAMTAIMWSHNPPPADTGDFSGPILKWGMAYSMKKIDETRAFCGDGSKIASFSGGTLKLYLSNFYAQKIPDRASTVIHEARHDDKSHNASNGRDTNWDYKGAWMYEVLWLWWFRAAAVNTTPGMKQLAKDIGNSYMTQFFVTKPPYVIN